MDATVGRFGRLTDDNHFGEGKILQTNPMPPVGKIVHLDREYFVRFHRQAARPSAAVRRTLGAYLAEPVSSGPDAK